MGNTKGAIRGKYISKVLEIEQIPKRILATITDSHDVPMIRLPKQYKKLWKRGSQVLITKIEENKFILEIIT